MKTVGKALAASVNDVLLSCVAGALRAYLVDKGDAVDGVIVRALVPVNLRPLEQAYRLGNHFGLVFLDLPIGIENPVERVLREGVVVGLANHTLLIRRDKSEIPIDDSAAPIRGPDGVLEGMILVFRDLSREKLTMAGREFLLRAGSELTEASDYRDALTKIAQLAVPRLADWCAIDVVEPFEADPDELRANPSHHGFERARHLGIRDVPVGEADERLDPVPAQIARQVEDAAGGLAAPGAEKEDWRERASAVHEAEL